MSSNGRPRNGVFHSYTSRLTAFEHTPHPTSQGQEPQNIVLFIGGLFDGFLTVSYPNSISDSLLPSWTLAQVYLSSSYTGWGTSSLARDAKELAECVGYFRTIKTGKIVLLGHSTGCQDVMEYLTGSGHETRPPIDGGIIQAPASDREAICMLLDPQIYQDSCEVAKKMIADGDGEEIVPSKGIKKILPAPISARRWLSLASPERNGDDDYFSSDLTDEQLIKTFGSLPARTPLCILLSGSDEYMPTTIDKARLLSRWMEIVKKGKGKVDEKHSEVIEGASHTLDENPSVVVEQLVTRVLGFLNALPGHPNL